MFRFFFSNPGQLWQVLGWVCAVLAAGCAGVALWLG